MARSLGAIGAVAFTALVVAACGGGGGGGTPITTVHVPPPTPGQTTSAAPGSGLSHGKITHIVVIVQENRSPDDLFHGLPKADIADSGLDAQGKVIRLAPIPLRVPYDIDHSHTAFLTMYDGGKMDGASDEYTTCSTPPPARSVPPDSSPCPYVHPEYGYVPPAEEPEYFALAERYTFGDRMFETNQGPSFPAHQFLIAGTSEPSAGSTLLASENPEVIDPTPSPGPAGCDPPAFDTVAMIDPSGSEAVRRPPCFDHPTVLDLLDEHRITWKYYAPSTTSIWTAPNAIRHTRFSADWANVIVPETNVFTDIASGDLAGVTWVIPNGPQSDHADVNDGSGPSWVASIVDQIGASPFWNSTAIIITWDDWGGWYDHVRPSSIYNSYEYGFRVPLIVVSPYARTGYVRTSTTTSGASSTSSKTIFSSDRSDTLTPAPTTSSIALTSARRLAISA
jgi:phospholipase C